MANDKRKAKASYPKRCMDFAEKCLELQLQGRKTRYKTEALRNAELGNGNIKSEQNLARRMSGNAEQILKAIQSRRGMELGITIEGMVIQYIELLTDPDASVSDKKNILDSIRKTLGMDKIETVNTNIETITDQDRNILTQIRDELASGKRNDS